MLYTTLSYATPHYITLHYFTYTHTQTRRTCTHTHTTHMHAFLLASLLACLACLACFLQSCDVCIHVQPIPRSGPAPPLVSGPEEKVAVPKSLEMPQVSVPQVPSEPPKARAGGKAGCRELVLITVSYVYIYFLYICILIYISIYTYTHLCSIFCLLVWWVALHLLRSTGLHKPTDHGSLSKGGRRGFSHEHVYKFRRSYQTLVGGAVLNNPCCIVRPLFRGRKKYTKICGCCPFCRHTRILISECPT